MSFPELPVTPSALLLHLGVITSLLLFFFWLFFFPSLIFKECEMSHVEGECLGYLGTATLVAQRSLCDPSNTTPQFCQPGSRWELKLLVLCAV